MKALVYQGPFDVAIVDKPEPKIIDPQDCIVRVTSTAICGSDLHLYHGHMTNLIEGQTLGHEFVGVVEDIGNSVRYLRRGDRVVVPFNIADGHCWHCQNGYWSQCEVSNPIQPGIGAAFGYGADMGGYDGGQAEFVRVPYADVGPLKLPDNVTDEQAVLLADIFPTGYYATDMGDVKPGDYVAIFGCGPVGLMAILSSMIRGAARVFAVDHLPYRLNMAKKLGATPINFDEENPAVVIKEATMHNKGGGVDVSIDAVGYEAVGHHASHRGIENPMYEPNKPMQVLQWMSDCTRNFAILSAPGVYGGFSYNDFPWGKIFQREQYLHMGQAPVKRYNQMLLNLIREGRVDPTVIITHRAKLQDAPKMYKLFDEKRDDCVKVVLST